jgi:hypothetical protein
MAYLNLNDVVKRAGQTDLPAGRCTMTFYHANSDILAKVYRDSNVTQSRPNPVNSNDLGQFPLCHLEDGCYRIVITDPEGEAYLDLAEYAVRMHYETGPVVRFNTIEELVSNSRLSYVNSERSVQVMAGDLVTTSKGNYVYEVLAPGAAEFHIQTDPGVKLNALPGADRCFTPEQLGYTDVLANWGEVAQKAWDAGFSLKGGPRDYLTSTTAYIRSRTGFVGEGDSTTGVKAVDGFDGNIIDTEDFADLVTNQARTEEDGTLVQPILKDFFIDGNRENFGGTASATNGIGIRLYCLQPVIENVRIYNVAGHGLQTALDHTHPNPIPFNSIEHSRIGYIDGLTILESGYEGWIFEGPADVPIRRFFIGNNGKAQAVYNPFNPLTSLYFAGEADESVDNLVLNKVGAEFADGHCWNCLHGRGIRVRADGVGVRARFFNTISEGNWGQVELAAGARVEFYGEIHGNAGGPRPEALYYDALTTPFTVGQVLSGGSSGASATITAVDTLTGTTGKLTLSFASDAARETHFQNGEALTDGAGGEATVFMPDAIGAVPWWKDEGTGGNLISLKTYQVGKNNGSTILDIGGSHHVYTVQCQSDENRYGHGIELKGNGISLRGFVEGRARNAASGEPSAGVIVRSGARQLNVDLIVKSCAQNVLFEDSSEDSYFKIISDSPLVDHMNGLGTLNKFTFYESNLKAVNNGSVTWRNRLWAITDAVDLSDTTLQQFSVPHSLPFTPTPSQFTGQLSWLAGATTAMPSILHCYPYAANNTHVTYRVLLGAGGSGLARLSVFLTRG